MYLKKPVLILMVLFFFMVSMQGAVITVGPGKDYPDIKNAVNAAVDKDLILVDAGVYKEMILINKGIIVAAQPNATVTISGGVTINQIAKNQVAGLLGIHSLCTPQDERVTLILENNQGSIRIENCEFTGSDGEIYNPFGQKSGYKGGSISKCSDVAFVQTRFKGGKGVDYGDGAHGLWSFLSTVTLYDCALIGGRGGSPSVSYDGGRGGSGYYGYTNSILFASDCFFKGGNGGDGADAGEWTLAGDGGMGGNGLWLASKGADAVLLDNTYEKGLGGKGGQPHLYNPGGKDGFDGLEIRVDFGRLEHLKCDARHFEFPSPIQEKATYDLTLEGNSGDFTGLFMSMAPSSMFAEDLNGQWLLEFNPSLRFFGLGALPPSGKMTLPITLGDLGPGVDSATIYLQSIFSDSQDIVLGPQRTLVLFDESF